MSQSVKEFVRQSGVVVQRAEPDAFRDVRRPTGTFRHFENSNNEFNNKKMMPPIPKPPIPSRLEISKLEPVFHDPFTHCGQFRINGVFDMQGLSNHLRQYGEVSYKPEHSPILYVRRGDHILSIIRSGNVQIVRAKTPERLQEAYKSICQILVRVFEAGNIRITELKRKYNKMELLPKMELVDLAKRRGVKNFRVGNRFATRSEICGMMNNNTQMVRKKRTNKNKTREKTVKKRGLDDNSIRKQLEIEYGSKWMKRYKPNLTRDIQNVKKAMNTLRTDKGIGLPFKGEVQELEKKMVNKWKRQREKVLEKKYLMKKASVTGIPYNLRNNWRNYYSNKVMNLMKKPSTVEVRKKWLKLKNK